MPKVANQWLREILGLLYRKRTLTRAEIIEATGLNPASLSHALRFLIERGTILKVGELPSHGGRRREVLNLNGEAGYFVAVDLEGASIRFALANLLGDIRCRWEEELEFGQPLPVRKVADGIRRVSSELNPRQKSRLLAVGVSYPGLLDDNGRLTAGNLGWRKFPLVEELSRAVETPIFFEHDKHSCVLAERWLGRAQHYQSGLFVIVERGVGVGIFLDGKTVEGWRDSAGELGHCVVDPAAKDLCNCGNRGCLEAIASGPNILRQYLEKTGKRAEWPRGFRVTDVFEQARRGDAVAQGVIERAGKALGRGLSHTIQLLNPEVVIFGGDVVSGEDLLLPVIEREIARRTLPDLRKGLTITMSGLGMDIRLKGAASLAFRRSFSDPVLLKKMCSPVLTEHEPWRTRTARK